MIAAYYIFFVLFGHIIHTNILGKKKEKLVNTISIIKIILKYLFKFSGADTADSTKPSTYMTLSRVGFLIGWSIHNHSFTIDFMASLE